QHSLPSALSFGVDAFPTDRLMLVTKAPKIPDLTPIITTPVIDANQSAVIVPPQPTVTIDPPPLIPSAPTLAIPALSNPSVLRPYVSSVLPSVIVTTDELLDLLEIDSRSPDKVRTGVIVPFEMPFSQTPGAAVYNSKTQTRYIKRIK
ncbi:MAG: hypothetical protein VCA36_13155, partial [Opitutales bacterium]